ncbi:Hypothetical predicted protein [Octopus vulgaris]|uniref:Uncharacterized protein n=1 Tax=Octopus vulgaris TaxID=6645 RepID=A0AA36EYN5_OCTVU|nr:Hypothetical predicted protein [Octopus vulgaris]
MRINEENSERNKLETGELEDVAEFMYLGFKITFSGGTDEDIKTRITTGRIFFSVEARHIVYSLRSHWISKPILFLRIISNKYQLEFPRKDFQSMQIVLSLMMKVKRFSSGVAKPSVILSVDFVY